MEQEEIFISRIDLTPLRTGMDRVRQEIGKILVGQNKTVDLILTAILADGHVLIEGVPGIAKTLTAKLTAKSINLDFSRIQFTPDLMPSDVLGTSVFNVKKSEFEFRPGPIFSNIVLIDEINRAPAKTQSALFEVMEERQATIDGKTYAMKDPYIVLATQNPIEQEGTYRLPEAQIDRFLMKIEVNYPSMEEEIAILNGFHNSKNQRRLDEITPVLSGGEIIEFRQIIQKIHVEERLIHYIAKIIGQTRNHADIYLGGSPRASLAVLASAKAYAGISGRDFITPEDIKFVLNPVLKHRLILSPEKEMEGVNPETVIKQIVDSIEVPR
jgi:MoxR-like ATPase